MMSNKGLGEATTKSPSFEGPCAHKDPSPAYQGEHSHMPSPMSGPATGPRILSLIVSLLTLSAGTLGAGIAVAGLGDFSQASTDSADNKLLAGTNIITSAIMQGRLLFFAGKYDSGAATLTLSIFDKDAKPLLKEHVITGAGPELVFQTYHKVMITYKKDGTVAKAYNLTISSTAVTVGTGYQIQPMTAYSDWEGNEFYFCTYNNNLYKINLAVLASLTVNPFPANAQGRIVTNIFTADEWAKLFFTTGTEMLEFYTSDLTYTPLWSLNPAQPKSVHAGYFFPDDQLYTASDASGSWKVNYHYYYNGGYVTSTVFTCTSFKDDLVYLGPYTVIGCSTPAGFELRKLTISSSYPITANSPVTIARPAGWTADANTYGTKVMLFNSTMYVARGEISSVDSNTYLRVFSSWQICPQASNPLYRKANNQCIQETDILTGRGYDVQLATIDKICVDTNCDDCKKNYHICTTCKSSYVLDGDGCMLPPCTAPQVWTGAACADCPNGQYYLASNSTCNLPSTFPSRKGYKLDGYQLVDCSDTNCSNCATNFSTCTTCDAPYLVDSGACVACGSGLVYIGANTSCLEKTNFGPKKGYKVADYSIQDCSDNNCEDCIDDFSKCVKCDAPNELYNSACRACSSGSYYLAIDSLCHLGTSFGIRKGYVVANYSVVDCKDSPCTECVANYAKCSGACDAPFELVNEDCKACEAGQYYLASNSTCNLPSTFPSRKGYKLDGYQLVDCSDTNCSNCATNFSTCTTCDAPYLVDSGACVACGSGLVYIGANTSCLEKTNFGPKKGYKVADYSIQDCSDNNCEDCIDDFSKCVKCDAPNELYNSACRACSSGSYYLAIDSLCHLGTSFGIRKGYVVANYSVVDCKDSPCTECVANYAKCSGACDAPFELVNEDCKACEAGQYYLASNSTCNLPSTFPSRKGYKLDGYQLVDCSDTNCSNCATNFSTCTTCDAPYSVNLGSCESCPNGSYYLTEDAGCRLKTNFGPKKGYKLDGYTRENCTDSNCTDCIDDYTKCTSCDAPFITTSNACVTCSSGLVYLVSDKQCHNPATEFPEGKGYKSDSYTLEPCQATGCANCADNYTNCIRCKAPLMLQGPTACNPCSSGQYYLKNDSICHLGTTIFPEGLGYDIINYDIMKCKNTNCKICDTDFTKCSTCNPGYNVSEGTCRPNAQLAVRTIFYVSGQSASLSFPIDVSSLPLDNLEVTFTDQVTNTTFKCASTDCKPRRDPKTPRKIYFDMKPSQSVVKGYATIMRIASTSRRLQITSTYSDPFAAPGLIIHDVHIAGSSNSSAAATHITYHVLNGIRLGTSVIHGLVCLDRAFAVTEQFSNMLYLQLLDGTYLVYPDRALSPVAAWKLLVGNLGNPFDEWVEKDDESGGRNYPRNAIPANLVGNWGQNFIILLGYFVVNMTIEMIQLYIHSKSSEKRTLDNTTAKSETNQILWTYFFRGWGIRFFFKFMEGLKLPIFFFSILHFSMYKSSSAMDFGSAVGIFCCLYYGTVTILCCLLGLDIWKQIQTTGSQTHDHTSSIQQQGSLLGLVDITKSKLKVFDFYYSDIRGITHFWHLLKPLVSTVRALLIALFMVVIKDHHVSLSLILAVEVLYTGYLGATLLTRKWRTHGILDLCYYILIILYISIKIATLSGDDEKFRQYNLGTTMAAVVYTIWGICLLDMVLESVRLIRVFFGKVNREEIEGTSSVHNLVTMNNTGIQITYAYPQSPDAEAHSRQIRVGEMNAPQNLPQGRPVFTTAQFRTRDLNKIHPK